MKYFFSIVASIIALNAVAQETYEMANLETNDLNGTARYVGMGGAMEALGADISTISTNPAGIGLFRKGQFSSSLGLVSQQGEKGFASANKTNMSFDQIGFVLALQTNATNYVNFGFNYHKSRNFCQILSVADKLEGASQSKLTLDKFAWERIKSDKDLTYSQVDVLYHETLYDMNLINEDGSFNRQAERFDGDSYNYKMGNHGYIGDYDFNISGNINNRVYLGATLSLHDVNYRGYSFYDEVLQPGNNAGLNTATLEDHRDIDGTGVDLKIGTIFRPLAESPLRVGLYIHTPTYYSLTSYNRTGLQLNDQYYQLYSDNPRVAEYDYIFTTPWKFGVSLGHTIDNYLALGATYEFSDYGSTDARIKDDDYFEWADSESDDAMNAHVKETLKGVSTLKLGAEYKPDRDISIRMGYNLVTPMYQEDAYRGVDVQSLGNYYSSTTEYINWKSTHRFTVGLGFALSDKAKIDVAYQYRTQKGDFLPFAGSDNDNLPFKHEVKNTRNQWLASFVYSF